MGIGYRLYTEAQATPETGWDAFSQDYASLNANPVYRLTKDQIFSFLEQNMDLTTPLSVLDFNCGTGNDLGHFLGKGHSVTGCDGSPAMLSVASERFPQVDLFLGTNEVLDPLSFGERKFDLIYSVIGGFAYVNDRTYRENLRCLATMLNPGGKIAVTNFNRLCLPDTLYNLMRLRPDAAFFRYNKTKKLAVKGQELTMHLLTDYDFRRIIDRYFNVVASGPVLTLTPPYQSGFRPKKHTLKLFTQLENKAGNWRMSKHICDQNIYLLEPKP